MKQVLVFWVCLIIGACAGTQQQREITAKLPPVTEETVNQKIEMAPLVNKSNPNQPVKEEIPTPSQSSISRPAENASLNPLWPVETGHATYYAADMEGRITASGEPYDPEQLTAAHKTIPLGSMVRVTNLKTQRHVVVRINDRWGGGGDRIINLSKQAATQLEFGTSGLVFVQVDVASIPTGSTASHELRSAPLPSRIEDNGSIKHSKLSVCQNEANILGLTGDFFRNHVAGCLVRGGK